MNRSESKYYNTACLMDEAFLLILEKKDFEYITVKEVCAKAGVNRSTFYLHYDKLSDLLDESLKFISKRFLEYYQNDISLIEHINDCSLEELHLVSPRYLLPYLEFVRKHKKLYMAVIKNHTIFNLDKTYEKIVKYVCNPILERFGVLDNQKKYVLEFYINGLMAIIVQWLKTDCVESPEEIITIIQKCMRN